MSVQKVRRNDERVVRNVNASMLAEGYRLSASTRKACANVASGKQSANQLVKARIATYTAKKK